MREQELGMSENIVTLLEVMTRLRDPDSGCPWDIEQDFKSIAPYTIEEAYEVAQAIEDSDMDALRDELGDLLLQVVYHAEMAREADAFNFDDVAAGISDKMIRRHPHVFADTKISDATHQSLAWETQKANERSIGRIPRRSSRKLRKNWPKSRKRDQKMETRTVEIMRISASNAATCCLPVSILYGTWESTPRMR